MKLHIFKTDWPSTYEDCAEIGTDLQMALRELGRPDDIVFVVSQITHMASIDMKGTEDE